MIEISPSIASADLLDLRGEIKFIDKNFTHIHLDVEDGVYLPNISFGFKLIKAVCVESVSYKSLHLMVHDPLFWLPDVKACRPDIVFIHTDHIKNAEEVLKKYIEAGLKTGLGLSNRDLGRNLAPLFEFVDTALVLTAEIEDPLQKYSLRLERFAAEIAASAGMEVWVDGDVTFPRLKRLEESGIRAAVMGRAIFQNRKALKKEAVIDDITGI